MEKESTYSERISALATNLYTIPDDSTASDRLAKVAVEMLDLLYEMNGDANLREVADGI